MHVRIRVGQGGGEEREDDEEGERGGDDDEEGERCPGTNSLNMIS